MKKYILFLPIVALLLSSCGGTSKDADKPSSYSNSSYGEVHKHTFATEWTYDSSKHWHSANCGHDLKKDEENHVWNNQVINPTYDTAGYTLHTCAVCGYSYKDSEVEKEAESMAEKYFRQYYSFSHNCLHRRRLL